MALEAAKLKKNKKNFKKLEKFQKNLKCHRGLIGGGITGLGVLGAVGGGGAIGGGQKKECLQPL